MKRRERSNKRFKIRSTGSQKESGGCNTEKWTGGGCIIELYGERWRSI